MFDLESFCQSLHGLTRSEIRTRCEERAGYFTSLERSSRHGRGGKDPEESKPDYRVYVESIGRLEHYVLGGGIPTKLSNYEIRLFQEVEQHMKD